MDRTIIALILTLPLASCSDDGKGAGDTGVTSLPTSDGTTTDATAGTTGDPSTTNDSASASTTGAGTSAGETGSDTASFLNEPDASVTASCDIWAQDCPDGEKCAPWANDGGNSWNSTRCVPLDANAKEPGDECTTDGSDVSGNDDCAVGSMCFSVNPETNVGLCVPFCQGSEASPGCADANQVCNISNDGSLILCLDTCNPLLQDCQEGGQPQGCYPVNDEFLCWPDFSFDLGAYGDPCQYFNVCDPGLYCAAADGVPDCQGATGCCTEYCDLTDANTVCAGAAGGAECVPWWDAGMAPPGQDTIGACVLPQ